MDKNCPLPFKVGQLAESRSFRLGFRGSWFRCKIKEISWRKGQLEHALEFFDFPDEKISWTRIYQVSPTSRNSKERERQLMVRPQYPHIYHESQRPHANMISEAKVVINGGWNVGDSVDWWKDGCYWSGRVTQILSNDKVQIELLPPPVGEGSSYEVFCKDLRPTLDWSPENGWSVPISKEGEFCRCDQLIKPVHPARLLNFKIYTTDEGIKDVRATAGPLFDSPFSSQISENLLPPMEKSKHSIMKEMPGVYCSRHDGLKLRQARLLKFEIYTADEGIKDVQETAGSLFHASSSSSSQISSNSLPPTRKSKHSITKETPEVNIGLEIRDRANGKTSWSDCVSSSHVRDVSAETVGHPVGEDQYYCSGSSKKLRTSGNISLYSMRCDTLEAAILDLEELANKVKWLKGILGFGVPLSDSGRPALKFVEHRASSPPK